MSATLVGLEPNRPKIPVVPLSITGPCIYGHIITDQHIRHFKELHSDIEIEEDDPRSLVSIASVIIPGGYTARTGDVFDGGQKRICLIHVDNRNRTRYRDLRWANDFMIAIEQAFGIEGVPRWYPAYRAPCTMLLDTSSYSFAMSDTQVGLEPDRPKIPVVPLSITGPCIYGHIITTQHVRHFKDLHPDIKADDPDSLVSIASIIIPGGHTARTANVCDGGQVRVCLIHVDNRDRTHFLDLRCGNNFRISIEKAFGIEGEPQWYPAYRVPCTTLLDTSSKTSTSTAPEGMTTLLDTSRYSMSATLVGLKPDRPKIPVVPLSITGPCIYGHIITDQHIHHFKDLHPDIKANDPDSLVSIASIIIPGGHTARTANVFDGGQVRVCLIHVDNRDRTHFLDLRCGNDFRIAIEKEFGIEGEPQWYPAYRVPCTTLLDTSSKTCASTTPEGTVTN